MPLSTPCKIYWTLIFIWLLFLVLGALFILTYPFEEYIRCWGTPLVLNANTAAMFIIMITFVSVGLFISALLFGVSFLLLSLKWHQLSLAARHLLLSSFLGLAIVAPITMLIANAQKDLPLQNIFRGPHCDSEGKPQPTLY